MKKGRQTMSVPEISVWLGSNSMKRNSKVSTAVIRRLPRYYRHLSELQRAGVVRISSSALGKSMGLTAEPVEDEWYLTAPHPMEKGHYLSFAALVTGEQVTLVKRWPEWDFQLRLPRRGHGLLYWHCTRHGLFRQTI